MRRRNGDDGSWMRSKSTCWEERTVSPMGLGVFNFVRSDHGTLRDGRRSIKSGKRSRRNLKKLLINTVIYFVNTDHDQPILLTDCIDQSKHKRLLTSVCLQFCMLVLFSHWCSDSFLTWILSANAEKKREQEWQRPKDTSGAVSAEEFSKRDSTNAKPIGKHKIFVPKNKVILCSYLEIKVTFCWFLIIIAFIYLFMWI